MVSCVLLVLLVSPHAVNWNLLERQTANGNTMKNILSILPILSVVGIILLFAACSHEELGTPFYAGQEVCISAALSSSNNYDGKKRISGKDTHPIDPTQGEINLTWDEGDKILVTVDNKSSEFILSEGAGSGYGTFTGTMPADGNTFHVTYPVNYTDDVLSHQTYTANGFGKGLMKMSTKIPGTLDNGFMLSADNSLLGLELQGDANVSKIVLTNNDNQKTYTLDCSAQVVNTTEATLFYIVVPAGVWANGLKVEVYNGNGIVIEERTKTSAAEFIAGQALMMPEVEINDWSMPSKRIGIFSIAKDKYVTFSQGYLQYVRSKDQWLFAPNQSHFTGERHYQNGQLADTIMYFGWSGKNSIARWGISLSTNANDYEGEFLDWGSNSIAGDAPNTWRSISAEEWMYLYQERENAEKLISLGMVESINGLIILPDSWILPAGMHFEPSMQVTTNQYSKQEWSIMENAGAIFLPMTGYFNHKTREEMRHINEEGYVRLNALRDGRQVYSVYKNDRIINLNQGKNETNLHYAFPVRLVHDTIRTYYYGITDEQFAEATSEWKLPGMGWAIKDQTPIQGKVLYGIRIKVASPGSFNLYKASSPMETSEANLQRVSTITTMVVGLQDIDFTEPFYLSKNEYLVVGCPSDASSTTLKGNHTATSTTIQPFYRLVGSASVASATSSSLMLDFY